MHCFLKLIERYFLVMVSVFSASALIFPQGFLWIKPHIPKFLGIIMFCMGVTLSFSDFVKIWKQRHLVVVGILAQYICMPLLALIISYLFQLPPEITIGMVIVGACPGGTASNVMAYLAGANLALSVTMTLCSTLLAPLLTPAIIYLTLSQSVDISFIAMVQSVFWIVCFPLLDGLLLRHFFHDRFKALFDIFPSISILSISAVIACVVALNREMLLTFPLLIFAAVFFHNGLGMSIGYAIAKRLKCSDENARTLAFEIGMQNSGLGVSLATQFFSAASALPGAIFSLWHNISGIVVARLWRDRGMDTMVTADNQQD